MACIKPPVFTLFIGLPVGLGVAWLGLADYWRNTDLNACFLLDGH